MGRTYQKTEHERNCIENSAQGRRKTERSKNIWILVVLEDVRNLEIRHSQMLAMERLKMISWFSQGCCTRYELYNDDMTEDIQGRQIKKKD